MRENWEIHWKNYYNILQLDPSAEIEAIRGAYNGLAKKYHPDHNNGTDAAIRMRDLNEAYETLSSSAKRAEYDAALRRRNSGGQPEQPGRSRSPGSSDQRREPPRTSRQRLPVVGICGRSCSGKGAATGALASTTPGVILIQADWYFYQDCARRCVYNGRPCIEHTNAVDSARLVSDLHSILQGKDTTIHIETPWLAQFAPTIRISSGDIESKRVVVVDGFLSFAVPELVRLFDYKVFIDASDRTVASRRLKRDGSDQYDYIWNVVIPVSKEYESPQKGRADVVLNGEASPQAVVWGFADSLNKSGVSPKLELNQPPWEVHFGDLVQDTAWHPVAFDNLKDWVKKAAQKRDPALYDPKHHPFGLAGNTFRYRKNGRTGQFEVRLSSRYRLGTCRYTREDSSRWK